MSLPDPFPIDVLEELIPSEPASITCQQNEEYLENDIPNESNGFTPVVKGENFLRPVPPSDGGDGLPYAPVDWPNPGDNWSWRVGRRTNSSGYYMDRFLYPPRHLQKSTRTRQCFASKASVKNYIQSKFPGADVDAFFASFSWHVPSTLQSETKAASPLSPEVEKEGKISRTTPRKRKLTLDNDSPSTTQRKGKWKGGRRGRRSKDEGSLKDESDQRLSPHIYISPESGYIAACHSPVEMVPEEFDNYLSSLDDILAQPLSEVPFSLTATISSSVPEDEMAEARSKLSSLLDVDVPSLVCSKNLSELTNLASKLRKDPTLSAEQLVKLKLIEEIPSFSEVFLENKETTEQADKFFAALEVNKATVTSLKKEYSELKEKADQLQTEVDSSSLAIQKIDDEIAQLQLQRAELASTIETKKKSKVDLTFAQKMLANSIPKVVREIQLANSKMPEWELKKENALKREEEILAKFEPLKGFTL